MGEIDKKVIEVQEDDKLIIDMNVPHISASECGTQIRVTIGANKDEPEMIVMLLSSICGHVINWLEDVGVSKKDAVASVKLAAEIGEETAMKIDDEPTGVMN